MSQLGQFDFFPVIGSTEPGFNSSANDTAALSAFESTIRKWDAPSGRAARFASKGAADFSITMGTSDIAATSSGGMLILGGTVETFWVSPSYTHLSVVSSTDVVVNVTIGYGQ